jgi:hypothetical protein
MLFGPRGPRKDARASLIESPAVSKALTSLVVGAALLVAAVAVGGAPSVVPLYDAVDVLVEPLIRQGGDYLAGAADRDFFRPIEYYLNLAAYRAQAHWLVLVFIVFTVAATAVALAWLATPQKDAASRSWRLLTAAVLLAHPLILASAYEYDRASQVLANLLGALALLCATRQPRAVALLLSLHVLGLASKESYAAFMVLSTGWAALCLWRQEDYRRLVALGLGCLLLLLMYRWLHAVSTNEALLAGTPRYQLSVGINALRNLALFVSGTLYLGSTARAAQGVSWTVAAWVAISVGVWTAWLFAIIRAVRRTPGGIVALGRGLAPLYLGTVAALLPSILTQGVSENNATCFALFFVAAAMALMGRASAEPSARGWAALGVVVAVLSCATGSLDKLARVRSTSADARFMAAEAREHTGQGRIPIDCRYIPRRRYSIYYMPSEFLVGSINRYLVARGELAGTDIMSCAR